MKNWIIIFVLIVLSAGFYLQYNKQTIEEAVQNTLELVENEKDEGGLTSFLHPLSIESLRNGEYPGSELVVEQTLSAGSNYDRYIASYRSEGLKIYGLLTIPKGEIPEGGWPAVIFNHGYIPPQQYKTTERYVSYTDGFSRNGYVLFRPDYRGHGNSEGQATGGYGSNSYTIDVLNALSSVKKLKEVNPQKIGMWGHSMGGFITLRSMVVNNDIKAGVIWGGVVASYPDLLNNWRRRNSAVSPTITQATSRSWRKSLVSQFGSPEENPKFWDSISANSYLSNISGPVQLHHGESDSSVPVSFSKSLSDQLRINEKEVELYTYPGDDHDITENFNIAMERSIKFFDKYLKGV